MCGRARCSLSHEEIRAAAKIQSWVDEDRFFPSYNACPGHSTPVVKHSKGGEVELHTMKWGLIPSYQKADDKLDYFRMFNARSETVAEKGVFKRLLSKQRCIVLLNGFYEWKKEGKEKQPYYIYQEGHDILRMAGLYDCWHGPEGTLYSFTILTTDSSEKLQWLHDRMPVILPDEATEQAWLSQEGGDKLCLPYNGDDLTWHPVDKYMSNMRNDGPQCCRPLKRKSIASFFKPKAQGGAEVKVEASAVKPEQTTDTLAGDRAAAAEAEVKAEASAAEPTHATDTSADGAAAAGAHQAGGHVKEERHQEQTSIELDSQPESLTAGAEEHQQQMDESAPDAACVTPKKASATAKPKPSPPSGKKRPANSSSGSGTPKRGKNAKSGQGNLDSFFIKNSA